MNVNIIGPVNSLGYGQACTNFMIALDKLDHKVAYFPVAGLNTVEPPTGTLDKVKQFYLNSEMFDPTAPCVRIWHQFDMAFRVGRGPFYAYPFFELDTFTEREKHHLGQADNIIVTCEWARNVVKQNLPDYMGKIHIVPLGVDTNVFRPKPSAQFKKTVFLTVGKWEIRKGHDVLCEAFSKAFNPTDNVELRLLCNNPFLKPEQTQEWHSKFKSSPMGDKIVFIPRQESSWDVSRIMSEADCGVFLSRGEGWNLDLIEMMACGKKVIVTNATAHTEFCTTENSLLVDTFGVEPAQDGIWFHGQGNWAKITSESVDKVVQYLRQVHADKQAGLNMTNEPGLNTARQFTWDNAARKLIGCIDGNFGVLS